MSKELIAPEVFRNYIDLLVSEGQLIYMNKSETAPAVKIPNTSYWWGKDRARYYDFCWHGPNAYSGDLPDKLKEKYPNWNIVSRFAECYQKRVESVSWTKEKKDAYGITKEWAEEIDAIKLVCDQGRWDDAMISFRKLNEASEDNS